MRGFVSISRLSLVVIVAAAAAVPAAREVERAMGRLNVMIYKSELAYYGLQPPPTFAPAPAPQGKRPPGGQE